MLRCYCRRTSTLKMLRWKRLEKAEVSCEFILKNPRLACKCDHGCPFEWASTVTSNPVCPKGMHRDDCDYGGSRVEEYEERGYFYFHPLTAVSQVPWKGQSYQDHSIRPIPHLTIWPHPTNRVRFWNRSCLLHKSGNVVNVGGVSVH